MIKPDGYGIVQANLHLKNSGQVRLMDEKNEQDEQVEHGFKWMKRASPFK
jgi:hypothetical protein